MRRGGETLTLCIDPNSTMTQAHPADSANAQIASPSYLLPVEDTQFLLRDELRAVRFALEYSKADLLLRDWGIRSTIIVFGSARVPAPERVEAWREARAEIYEQQ